MPFGDDVMTIIMGIDPCEPGMHGPLEKPCPTDDAVGLVTKIRDMCEEWLCSTGKDSQPDKPMDKPDDAEIDDMGEDE